MIEELRRELRELIKFIDADGGLGRVYTNFEDEIGEATEVREFTPSYGDFSSYRLKVERFVREHKDHLTIRRLMHNEPITSADLHGLEEILFSEQAAEDRTKFEKVFGKQPLGRFIRSLVGLDRSAAKAAFTEYLSSTKLSPDQITFVNQIIDHLVKNGVMNPERLFEPPFTDKSSAGLAGVFPSDAEEVLRVIERINTNAEAA